MNFKKIHLTPNVMYITLTDFDIKEHYFTKTVSVPSHPVSLYNSAADF